MKSTKRKVGRPKSGKKAYCVRMTPAGHDAVLKLAKAAGFAQLGDWLHSLAAASAEVKPFGDMADEELTIAFAGACDETTKALNQLLEILDHTPHPTKSDLKAFRTMRRRYQHVIRFAHEDIRIPE